MTIAANDDNNRQPMNWLKWLSVALLVLAGLLGLGMSLCGGVFLAQSLGKSFSANYGVGWIALIALAIGMPVLVWSFRQLRAVVNEPHPLHASDYPPQVKTTAVLTAVSFLFSGYWIFLPIIVSLLRRRKWSRPVITILTGAKWLYLLSWLTNPYGSGNFIVVGLFFLAMDIALLSRLYSAAVTAWLNPEKADQDFSTMPG